MEKKKDGLRGGLRGGAGAKPFSKTRNRPIKVWGKRLYEDQCHLSAEYVRQALDLNEVIVNALGNPYFSAEKIIELLTPHATDGSVIAFVNAITDMDERAKRLYLL